MAIRINASFPYDFAALRINNMTIVAPADNFEAAEVIKSAVLYENLSIGRKKTIDGPT